MLKLRAGDRLKVIRELMGLTRDEFAELLKLDYIRLKNIEQKRAKVAEFEYEQFGQRFPELIPFFTYEGDIVISDLSASNERLCRLVAAKIEAGQIPQGFYLEEKIKE
ncbi:helix-turn-helix domain-containing protein [Microbulbifer sp. OS29]|uniref:Helix-turn-helix domain-containing protein n=1 Tax=Microbulbifer okhotskensis TaxID=2926617 RepID=A0A9X2EPF3_9GAMM|nr:helix-turn-helix transcriptional regulator [Microbulbifer okhotskensis]MCO1336004.1 helix-turn-helix domain-containing protein [Microbulbifer okhotskensis]